MDEIDYTDTGFNDFMEMHADNDPNKKMVQNQQLRPKASVIKTQLAPKTGELNPLDAKLLPQEGVEKKGLLSGMKGKGKGPGVGGYMQAASGGLELLSIAKGDTYDTSAEGGGPGSAMSAITGAATKGASAGAAFGPWGMAAGAVVGGVVGGVSQKKAVEEWADNIKKKNLSENEIAQAESAETYQMEQGKESLGLLKGLRQKQLGIFNS